MLIHEKEITISEEFIDQNQHVNNVQYVQWVEMMASEHWDLVKHMCPYSKDYFFLLDHHIQYKKQVFLGEKLIMKTYPLPPKGAKQARKVEFYRNGELVVDSLTNWILINHQNQKIIRLPENWLDVFKVD